MLCGMGFVLSLLFSLARQDQRLVTTANFDWSFPPFAAETLTRDECRPLTPEDVDYTLVTQCSEDRLWMLPYHCQRWPAAISLAVYTNRSADKVHADLSEDCPHLTVQTLSSDSILDYPVNDLRNLALSAVQTSHIMYVDVDFWESTDLYRTLQQASITEHLAADDQYALIVPAFALRRQCREWKECPEANIPKMPATRDDLVPMLLQRMVTAFDPWNIGGHGSTRYSDWIDQGADELLPIECTKSNRYEPYLVVRHCRSTPPFQAAFTGYGKNKMTWMMQLRKAGWRFWQVADFVIHYPHLDSKARLAWNGGDNGQLIRRPTGKVDWMQYRRGRTDRIFVEFREWLARTYDADGEVTGLCEDARDDDAKLWVDHPAQHDAQDDTQSTSTSAEEEQ